MPEIKHGFSAGKMNKDLDERMIPNGQYRDAMNIQVSTSEGSDVGTVQNLLGNKEIPLEFIDHNGNPFSLTMPSEAIVVGSISDEKVDTLYWFIWTHSYNLILSHKRNDKLNIVFYDTKDVLKFEPNNIITGINVIDDMLFWTDNKSEPKKINISRCTKGTRYPNHTRVINDQQGVTWSNGIDIEEKHITVIKKTPPVTMEMKLTTLRKHDKIYTGVTIIEPSPGFNFSSVTTLPGNNIVNPTILSGIDSLGNEVALGNVSNGVTGLTGWQTGSPGPTSIEVGTKVVFKPFDDDSTPPGLPVTDYVLKGVIEDAHPNNPNATTWTDGVKVRITSIDGFPPLPDVSQGQTELKYVVDYFDESEKLFEFKFPRFSYRYKYDDGEYSPFAPFTQVAFVPGAFDYHPRKGYNIGMTNRLSQVELGKFINDDTPKDVVAVDILFKDEASTSIYIVDTIRPDDDKVTGALYNTWNTIKNGGDDGYYIIDKETINSVVPSNQLLRPWDNVPRKALAQDITGNRVVYGNYVQNYNLIYDGKKHLADFKYAWDEFPEPLTEVGKSIKSLREYQLGVVFIDKYGRETPVISNPTGTMKLEKESADLNNRIRIGLKGYAPEELTHFKFFVKETANEYYNMAMDRWYNAEDGNIWLAFPSSDRNKVDIDTFLILKKGSDKEVLVKEAARYKVLAIESEAPDFIKTSKILVSSKNYYQTSSPIFIAAGSDVPLRGVDSFKLNYTEYHGSSGQNLDKLEEDIYVSFGKVGTDEVSDRYRVSSITNDWDGTSALTSASGDAVYSIQLKESLSDDVNFISNDPMGINSNSIENGAIVNIYKYKVENLPRFDGRFFVKIYFDEVFKNNISKSFQGNLTYRVSDWRKIYAMKSYHKALHTSELNNFMVDNLSVWESGGFNWNDQPDYGYYRSEKFASFALFFRRYKKDYGTHSWDVNFMVGNFSDLGLFHLEPGSGPNDITYLGQTWRHANGSDYENGLDGGAYGYTMNWHETNAHTMYESAFPYTGELLETPRDTEVWFIDNGPVVAKRTSDYALYWPGVQPFTTSPTGLITTSGSWSMNLGFGGIKNAWDTPDNFFNIGDWNGPASIGINSAYADPPTKEFVEKLNPGYSFRWKEDPDQTIYTIQTSISGGSGVGQYLRHSEVSDHFIASSGVNEYDDESMAENISFNFTKNWGLNTIKPALAWNPWESGEIALGQTILLKSVTEGAGGLTCINGGGLLQDDLKIFVADITDTDTTSLSFGNRLSAGMALSRYSNAGGDPDAALTASTHLGSSSNSYLVIRHIEKITDAAGTILYYELWLGGYDKAMTLASEHQLAIGTRMPLVNTNYTFVQVGMNGYSPNSEFNINTMGAADGNAVGKVGAVGYTLQFIEPIEPEEILSENPAIWETEPKDAKDLDIYYEATSAIPMKLTGDNIHEAIPIGSTTSKDISGDLFIWEVIGYDITDPLLPQLQLEPLVTVGGIAYTTTLMNPNAIRIVRPDGLEFGVVIQSQTSLTDIVAGLPHLIEPDPDIYNANFFLSWHNCYSFGNGVESDRIRDNYNLPFIANGVKASTTLEQEYKEEHRKYGLIYSGIYNSTSGVNNLNQFIQAEKITKDINPIYGSIQKLHSRDSDLVTLCEDKCLRIMANKDAVFNADGNTNLTATSKVLGQTIPFSGEFGISKNPESFASESYRTYFADKVRGVILRLSKDGLTPISMHGMKDWFRDNLKLSNRLIGSHDDRNDEYNIALKSGIWEEFPCKMLGYSKSGVAPYDPSLEVIISNAVAQLLNIGDLIVGDGILQGTTITGKSNLGGGEWEITISQLPNILSLGSYYGYGIAGGGVVYWKSNLFIFIPNNKFSNTVLSFREDVKGWVSFKSFTDMEFGLSMANDYYTFKNGYIHQHDQEDIDRNTFYGIGPDQDPKAASSVTVVLNDNPSIIKTFNTLNYEGSQSKIDKFTFEDNLSIPLQPDTNYNDQEYYNLYAKDGWSVESITTDKEIGYVNEFIEKEGKWFNNINRLIDLSLEQADTSDFTFQGIGFADQVDVLGNGGGGGGQTNVRWRCGLDNICVPCNQFCQDNNPTWVTYATQSGCQNNCSSVEVFGCMDPLAINYDPLATIDDGSCLYEFVPATCGNLFTTGALEACDDFLCLLNPPLTGCSATQFTSAMALAAYWATEITNAANGIFSNNTPQGGYVDQNGTTIGAITAQEMYDLLYACCSPLTEGDSGSLIDY